ncbi:vesicular-fusion protein SEC18 [Coniophora puteana RWD-64-598 SS2]|uniref:Vesicular-fusion protein SEC18 n=1 Tax=Coniophora puteana (strain RWD-64-598) TaxID=741705 RepID=A0A5M3MCB8_CONPW|nr:vesicular-fusion protein SEC18 [Coniophora puteana RWD-64-598 SS2]EIW76291.1 vesicular-fusion protein SEC18 [Coniophora puteana RWD-64-598 SS2]
MRYAIVSMPNEALAFSNRVVVNPSDFPSGQHVLVKRDFPMTTLHDNTGKIAPGTIAVSQGHREWIGLSLVGDSAPIDALPAPPHSAAPPFLESLDLTVGFIRKNYDAGGKPFSADDMTKTFLRAYAGVVFAPGEILTFEFHGEKLRLQVVGVRGLELADEQQLGRGGGGGGGGGASGAGGQMGILMEKTDVTMMKAGDSPIVIKSSARKAASNAIIAPNFKFEEMGIGGLDDEFGSIFRRAFASRVFPPALVEKLGIQHVKGILLHGPPGTGKTLIARQIGKMLNAREPKIVNGPEILNKYVGASEENIRKLFADAEKEYKEKGEESGLHIIIFDEMDAIFKQRGSTNSGTGVGDTVVNQLLSKLDGVDQLNNILVIGMTNRMDMIDEAVLRPGRLEVHMEISLPDARGRHQILRIHTTKMRTNRVMADDVDLPLLADKAKNFSGAEIEGLVKSATSFAFNRHIKVGTMAGIGEDVEDLKVCMADFECALEEVHPAFGVSEEELEEVTQNGMIPYAPIVQDLLDRGHLFVKQVSTSTRTPLVSVLLHGPPGSGKTVLAATIAQTSAYPFIKLISPDRMVGFSEAQKIQAISKTFADSYKSPLSVIVVDNLERLLDWTSIGPRFSNSVLQTLLVLIARKPPKGRRLLVIATTSLRPLLTELGLADAFDTEMRVPPISNLAALEAVLRDVQLFPDEEGLRGLLGWLADAGFARTEEGEEGAQVKMQVGIKKLLSLVEMARQEPDSAGVRLMNGLMGLQ